MVTQILVTFCCGIVMGYWITKFSVKGDKSEEAFVTFASGLLIAFLVYIFIMFTTLTTYINVCENHKGITIDPVIIDFANCNHNTEEK